MLKFQIILKLPSVESSACLYELPGTEFEGSVVPINEAAWSAMRESIEVKDFVILIALFLVE